MTGRRDRLGRQIGYNWWREMNWEQWHGASQAWRQRYSEENNAVYYDSPDLALYKRRFGGEPTFKQFLETNKGIAQDQAT